MKLEQIKNGQMFEFEGIKYLKTASVKPINHKVNEILVVNLHTFSTIWSSDQVEVKPLNTFSRMTGINY
jgi:hypothetical protein